jgi:hypothetical protein
VSFATVTLCVSSERVFIFVVVYFVIESVRKLLDTSSYNVLDWDRDKFKIELKTLSQKPVYYEASSINKRRNRRIDTNVGIIRTDGNSLLKIY